MQYLEPVTQSGTFTTSYSYSLDGLNRLLEAVTKNSGSTTVNDYKYGYDNNGNITSKSVQSTGLNETYAYNAADELTTKTNSGGSTTYSYDGIGNLTGSTAGASLSYNTQNETTKNGSTTYTYSGTNQSERVQVNSDTFVYGGLGLTTAKTSAGTTEYVRCSCGMLNNERTPDGKKYYYLFDGLGSVIGMTNSSGQEVNSYEYDPYGNIFNQKEQSGLNNPWKYASGYFDSNTGLTKFGIRYYDATVGRWTQRTPVGGSLQETLKANPYVYAGDNPVNEVDPSGADYCNISTIKDSTIASIGWIPIVTAIYIPAPCVVAADDFVNPIPVAGPIVSGIFSGVAQFSPTNSIALVQTPIGEFPWPA